MEPKGFANAVTGNKIKIQEAKLKKIEAEITG